MKIRDIDQYQYWILIIDPALILKTPWLTIKICVDIMLLLKFQQCNKQTIKVEAITMTIHS